jgi:hypothetical protein
MYAAGLAQARRLDAPCEVNLAFYRHVRPARNYSYSYGLDVFDSGVVVPDDDAAHQPVFLGLPAVPAATIWHNRIGSHIPTALGGPPVFMERSFRFDDRIDQITPGTTILGMFQSWKYFADIEDELRDRMTRLTEPSDWYLSMVDQIHPGQGAIALNVRRGDYVLPEQQRIQGLATRDYYAESLSHLRRMGFDGPIYVASDSLDAVMQEFDGLGKMLPIAPPPGVNPYEVLLLLSRVDALVAANSTFSWWAGFLGERPGHVVVAPRPWLTQANLDTRDLLPGHWLTLDRDGRRDSSHLEDQQTTEYAA